MKTYRVRPLEWEPGPYTVQGSFKADTIFGLIVVARQGNSFWWDAGVRAYSCESLEDGKAAAEAWYLEKLEAALEEVEGE